MLQIQTTHLSQEQYQCLHPDFLANEQAYLQMRESLMAQYNGQWVAVYNGAVIAADTDLITVTEAAAATDGNPYIARVGAEDSTLFRVRLAIFAYDHDYKPFALPRITATFYNHTETESQAYADVIPKGRLNVKEQRSRGL